IDNAISVFAELCKAGEQYECVVFTHIINHLKNCRPKEVCQHAERAFICVNKANSKEFAEALNIRKDVLNASQINRVNKLMRKIEQ
ncbi:MAG: hypothetical protein Q8920_03080, partial [Bacillota bacterium]|nr:hypothetical protein [Bacillota bacterium]